MRIQHGNGGFSRWLATVARTEVLILDDWGLAALDGPTRSGLLEIIDDRAGTRATIVTSRLPVEHGHAWIGDATIADAILDRLLSRGQRHAVLGLKLLVLRCLDHGHTLRCWVLHFGFEAALVNTRIFVRHQFGQMPGQSDAIGMMSET